ncbi:hypothetical protein V3C99_004906 [Haemonchus contortus]
MVRNSSGKKYMKDLLTALREPMTSMVNR